MLQIGTDEVRHDAQQFEYATRAVRVLLSVKYDDEGFIDSAICNNPNHLP